MRKRDATSHVIAETARVPISTALQRLAACWVVDPACGYGNTFHRVIISCSSSWPGFPPVLFVVDGALCNADYSAALAPFSNSRVVVTTILDSFYSFAVLNLFQAISLLPSLTHKRLPIELHTEPPWLLTLTIRFHLRQVSLLSLNVLPL